MVEREIKIACRENPLMNAPGLEVELIERRHFEDNVLLDFDDRRLTASDRVLRLRTVNQRGWLTYKSAPQEHPWLKVRDEIQVALDEPQAMLALLEAIGFNPVFRYQKFRTHYRVRPPGRPSVDAAFDETPMGDFLELEGDAEAIATLIEQLNVSSEVLIQASYPELWAERRRARDQSMREMIFSDDQLKEKMKAPCGR